MGIDGLISYTLFIFWIGGCLSICVDIDHIFVIFGRKPPIKLSDSFGRPFHTRAIFTFVAIVGSFIVVTLANGFYREILFRFGEGGTIVFLVILIVLTYISSKFLGQRILKRMKRIRWHWRHEYFKREKC